VLERAPFEVIEFDEDDLDPGPERTPIFRRYCLAGLQEDTGLPRESPTSRIFVDGRRMG
jgi:hypothetical protein